MRRTLLLLTMVGAMLLAFGGVVLAQSADPPQTPTGKIPDRYIVVLEDDVGDPGAAAREHAQRHGAEVSHVYRYAIKGYAARIPSERLADVRADARVLFVSEDREVRASAETLPTGVNRIEGDLSSTKAGDGDGNVAGSAVAIIDSGIDTSHPDLNVAGGKNCSTGSSYKDGYGHGTHVAGTAAAKDTGSGVVGAAPGAPLYAVRVLDNRGSGSTSSVVCGIDWVTQNAASMGIKVANMSLGGSGSDDGNCGNSNSDAQHKAVCGSVDKGITYVVAAGNDGKNFSGTVPAAYNEVLTVTAMADSNGAPGGTWPSNACRTDKEDTPADFSNFTITTNTADLNHTIAAPGVCILSTKKGGGTTTMSGTSMAAPHVAGTAALCISSLNCTGGPSDIMKKLRTDAANQPTSYGFDDDPNDPNPFVMDNGNTRYYGHLEYAGGY